MGGGSAALMLETARWTWSALCGMWFLFDSSQAREHLSRRRQTGEIFSCTLNGDAGKTEAGTSAQADKMIFMLSKKNKWINKNISKKLVVLFK